MTETINLAVCEDCVFVIANGEYPEDETRTQEIVAGETRWHAEGYTLAVGDDYDQFSWGRCDVCHTRLGGSRHEAYALVR